MEKAKAVYLVAFAILAIALANGVIAIFAVWPPQVYDFEQGTEFLWSARKMNNLLEMAEYMDKAVAKLANYHGNPCWWYPKIDTDLDVLRQDISRASVTAKEIAKEGTSSWAYQQAVQNLQETLLEIIDHLKLASTWMTMQSVTSVIWYLIAIIAAITLIAAFFASS